VRAHPLRAQALEGRAPVIAQPNAGHPKRVGHRNIYMATDEYFLVYAKRSPNPPPPLLASEPGAGR